MPNNNSMIKIIMLSIIALVILAVIGIFFIEPMVIKKELPKPIVIQTQDQPVLGNPTAKVHIVAFEDLKCSNCARFDVQLMPIIKKQFIDTGVANYTLINLAFISGSMPAANAARCVYKQNSVLFFDYTNYIFHHQPPENQNWATIPTLMNYASQIKGINTDQLAQCLVMSPYDEFIHNNLVLAMKTMKDGIVATPTLYINGILVNPLTQSQIDKVIKAVK